MYVKEFLIGSRALITTGSVGDRREYGGGTKGTMGDKREYGGGDKREYGNTGRIYISDSLIHSPFTDALVALKNEERKSQEAEVRKDELHDKLLAFEKNNKLGLMEADGKLKHASKQIRRLEDDIKKLKAQLEV